MDHIPYDDIRQFLGITAEDVSRMDEAELARTKHNARRARLGMPIITKEEWDLALKASENDLELTWQNADRAKEGLSYLMKGQRAPTPAARLWFLFGSPFVFSAIWTPIILSSKIVTPVDVAVVFVGVYLIGFVMVLMAIALPILNETRRSQQAQIRLKQAQIICPHCQVRGRVRTFSVQLKKGLSAGKATAALLTGGTSLLVTGLSRKVAATRAICANCSSTWDF